MSDRHASAGRKSAALRGGQVIDDRGYGPRPGLSGTRKEREASAEGRLKMRKLASILSLAALTSCTGGGINAGEEGGIAFIAFAVMLILGCAVLWFIMGREE
jgi:hypothetical protein